MDVSLEGFKQMKLFPRADMWKIFLWCQAPRKYFYDARHPEHGCHIGPVMAQFPKGKFELSIKSWVVLKEFLPILAR